MARYVIDASIVLHLLAERLEGATRHELLAPTLLRSEILDALFGAVESGELPKEVGFDRLGRFARMRIRYLGDNGLRRRAWTMAKEMGWASTRGAEYLALTVLQADAFLTLDAAVATAAQ